MAVMAGTKAAAPVLEAAIGRLVVDGGSGHSLAAATAVTRRALPMKRAMAALAAAWLCVSACHIPPRSPACAEQCNDDSECQEGWLCHPTYGLCGPHCDDDSDCPGDRVCPAVYCPPPQRGCAAVACIPAECAW